VFHADKIVAPILILQGTHNPTTQHPQRNTHSSYSHTGEKDTVVVKEHSLTFKERAKNSPYVEYHEYPGEGHMLLATPTKLDMLKRIDTFLRKWVLPK